MMKGLIKSACLALVASTAVAAGGATYPLKSASVDFCDKASLQRGAALFANYCSGCHSLQYARYNTVAKDIGLVDKDGKTMDKLIMSYLNLSGSKPTDSMVNNMTKDDATTWFGAPPPDLSLVSRLRGSDWVYTYLTTFYVDHSQPWGVNNAVFPNVGMPHAMVNLQGEVEAVIQETDHGSVVTGFKQVKAGEMTPEEYDQAVQDLVNYLDYIGEPQKSARERIGVFTMLFLLAFTVLAWMLKREYWKDVK